ncbi:MAG TPA: hypothetical protein VMR06_00205 [Dokdonella sp.]|uniref:hypothetical protein n=1 Tax=Dokdonella sp. TaxID=2291710 RepID=UPI002D0876AB|nr:hypothetical protein [Dokdonella sp.]HUD40403.1 hypothetical protein [Dokdonella sp.]
MKRFVPIAAVLMLAACHSLRPSATPPAPSVAAAPADGLYDNHEQVWQAGSAAGSLVPPRLRLSIATYKGGWQLWRVEADGGTPTLWLMQMDAAADGTPRMLPHRPRVAAPTLEPRPDPAEWTALDACTLTGPAGGAAWRVAADAAACATIAPGIGAAAAFLPIAAARSAEGVDLRLYADQARGPDAVSQARRVDWYGGWAAVNGAGPEASADNRDWHMNRQLRLSNEGGRSALVWRDGTPSGWSLLLERLTFREGNTPVLKLSILDDADGRALAYAFADPHSARIGINLGWIQVGLERETGAAQASNR